MATMFAGSMGAVGGGFGYLCHLVFVRPSDIDNPDLAQTHVFYLCLTAAIVFTLLLLIAVLIIRERPPIPPT